MNSSFGPKYEIIKNFVGILVQTMTSKRHFEINWPLGVHYCAAYSIWILAFMALPIMEFQDQGYKINILRIGLMGSLNSLQKSEFFYLG